jgi:hypothetical protein
MKSIFHLIIFTKPHTHIILIKIDSQKYNSIRTKLACVMMKKTCFIVKNPLEFKS